MKKIFFALTAAFALASCTEMEPVVTFKYDDPAPYGPAILENNYTIAQLAATYDVHGKPFEMKGNKVIKGRVSTTDQPGNFYKSFYIQDETGGMEIKIGRNGIYNEFKEGQEIYIDCNGLFLGEYGYKSGAAYGNGMVQIGFDGTGTDYETSYLESKLLIDTHIFRGDPSDIRKVTPVEITENDLPGSNGTLANCPYIGKLVTLKNLTYGWYDSRYSENNEAFALLYINSQKDKKASANRIFISGENTGLNRWGLSKERMSAFLESGMWDKVQAGNANDYNYGVAGDKQYKNLYIIDRGDALQEKAVEVLQKAVPAGCVAKINTIYSDIYRGDDEIKTEDVVVDGGTVTLRYVETYPGIERAACSVSQYFSTANGTCVQIRTSGYCKFADIEVPEEVLKKSKTIDVTGILTLYQGKVQITVNRIEDIK